MEDVLGQDTLYVPIDIVAKSWINLVENVTAIEERPHLADGLVTDPGDNPRYVIEVKIDGAPFLAPMLLLGRRAQQCGEMLALLDKAHCAGGRRLMR